MQRVGCIGHEGEEGWDGMGWDISIVAGGEKGKRKKGKRSRKLWRMTHDLECDMILAC